MAGRQTNAKKFAEYSNMSLTDIEQWIEQLREVVYEKKGKPTEAKYYACARELQTMLELRWWCMQQRPQHATCWFKSMWMWVHVNCFYNKCLLFQINLLDDNYWQWLLILKKFHFPWRNFQNPIWQPSASYIAQLYGFSLHSFVISIALNVTNRHNIVFYSV